MRALRFLVCFGMLLVFTGSVQAQSNLHISSNGSFSQSGGGTDWTTLPLFDGNFSILDVSNKSANILPFHIVFAVPNQTGVLADAITKVGTTSVNISPGPEVILTSGSAYDALGVSGANSSVSFTNFVKADTTVGLSAPTSYGLNDFTIGQLALLNQSPLDIKLSGLLPAGTIIFAYGFDNLSGKEESAAFTNSGVVVTPLAAVPEPSTITLAIAGGLGVLGYVAWQRKLKAVNNSGLAVGV